MTKAPPDGGALVFVNQWAGVWNSRNRNLLNSYFCIYNMKYYDYIFVSGILHGNTNFVPCSFFYINQHWLTFWEICAFIDILLRFTNRH